jgi:hypothetical protein
MKKLKFLILSELEKARIFDPHLDSDYSQGYMYGLEWCIELISELKGHKPLQMYDGELPHEILALSPHKKFESFLRVIIKAPDLASQEGGGLSQGHIAHWIGTSQKQVSLFFKILLKHKIIVCTDQKYVPNGKCKKYTIISEFLLNLYKSANDVFDSERGIVQGLRII